MKARRAAPTFAALVAVIAFALAAPQAAAQAPEHVYFTWRGSTSTSVTVNAQTVASVPAVEVRWDTEPRGGEPAAYRHVTRGSAHRIPGLRDGRWIHWVDLTGLEPGGRYWLVVGSDTTGFSPEKSVRTVPADDRPLRFVVGGDQGLSSEVRELHAQAASRSPAFAVIGGDIAYANGDLSEVDDWDDWLRNWEEGMVTPDGLSVPIVAAPGNHEVRSGYVGGVDRAPFYIGFFAQPGQPSFFRLAFGSMVAFYILDSGHIVSHEEQGPWLSRVMAADAALPYRFAAYHVPLYPSHRDYDDEHSQDGRRWWLPVFDANRLTTAFEHHEHTLKRTKLLKGDSLDAGGTLYLGDGAWGRGDRDVNPSMWYLANAADRRHMWIVDVSRERVEYTAVGVGGTVLDRWPER